MTHHLVGVTEIAAMLGVSRQRADQITRSRNFPAPAAELANGRVWETTQVEMWLVSRAASVEHTKIEIVGKSWPDRKRCACGQALEVVLSRGGTTWLACRVIKAELEVSAP